MTKLVAIYTRVSSEDLEVPASTRRQEHACRLYATQRGWEVADVWEDVDLSAYKKVRRPAFEDLMRVVAGAKVDGVLAWKLDRLVRRPADFERFWSRCDHAGVFLASATEPIDSTNDLGLAVIRILVTFANVESSSISLRMRARWEEKARAGMHLGRERGFGVTEDWSSLVSEEVILIQEAAQRVLDGESLSAIAADWRLRNVRGPQGGFWSAQSLSRMLAHPRLAGDNTYRGEVVARGCFPPILDPLTAARVRAALANLPRQYHATPRPYLLAGFLRCAKCGNRLHGSPVVRRASTGEVTRTASYHCHGGPTGCGHTHIKAPFVEDLIVSVVLYRLEKRPRTRPDIEAPPDASERLAAAFERHASALRTLARDYYVTRRLTREEWFAARDGLERELMLEQRAARPQWRPSLARKDRERPQFRAEWDSLDLNHRRDIIASELECAYVSPSTRPGVLDASRVRVVWWDDGPELPAVPLGQLRTSSVAAWDPNRWMGTREVSDRLGLHVTTIATMARTGRLSPVRLGRHYRYLRSDVEATAQRLQDTLGVSEAVLSTGLRRDIILRAIWRDELPATRRGTLWRIRPEDLAAFVKSFGDASSQLIGTSEAARLLGVDPVTVRAMIHRGELHGSWCRHRMMLERREVSDAAARIAEARIADDSVGSREAIRYLGVSIRVLHQLVRDGQLSVTKVHGHYRIKRAELARTSELLASRAAETRSRLWRIKKPVDLADERGG